MVLTLPLPYPNGYPPPVLDHFALMDHRPLLYLGTKIQLLLRLLLLLLLLLWILLLFPPVPSVTGRGVPYKFALHAICETGRGVPCSLVTLCAECNSWSQDKCQLILCILCLLIVLGGGDRDILLLHHRLLHPASSRLPC